MLRPDIIIVKKYIDNDKEDYEHGLPHDEASDSIMNSKAFKDYVAKHGYHFTESLANYASKMMKNADNSEHSWPCKQVLAVINANYTNFVNHNKLTNGDLAYTANMAYADFYPEVLKSETDCVKYALKIAADPDGYEGIVFMRWLSDLIGKDITGIDFSKYM